MCFRIDENDPDKRIAKRDIVCWKVVDINKIMSSVLFKSMYKDYVYKFDTEYYDESSLEIEKEPWDDTKLINKGFHSYKSQPTEYAYNNCTNHILKNSQVLVECYIPKGSEYYINLKEGEYVSDSIHIGSFDYIYKQVGFNYRCKFIYFKLRKMIIGY